MSVVERQASPSAREARLRFGPLRRLDGFGSVRSPPAAVLGPAGRVGLAASVGAAAWIAVGASDGLHWLELPGGGHPAWIDGPLRGLASTVGSLPPSAVSASLIVLALGYFLALGCAGAISLRSALAAVALANLAFTLGPTLVSTDVFGYIAYARESVRYGLNPYLSAPSAVPHDTILPFVYWRDATSPYGPLFTGLSAPLGLISTTAALWTYKAIAGLSSVVIAFMVARAAPQRGRNPARAAILVGLNPIVLFYSVSGAHNDLLAVALLVIAMWLLVRERASVGAGAGSGAALRAGSGAGLRAGSGAAASVAVAAAAIKVTLGLALPFILLGARRRGRAALGATIAIVAIGVPALVLFGTHFFDQLHRITSDPQFDIAFSGPDRLATALGTHIGSLVRTASTGFAVACAVAAIVWAWRGGDWITAAGWAMLGLLASIASLAPWYLVWLLPFAALGRSRALMAAAMLATCYLVTLHLPVLGHQPWLSHAGDKATTASVQRVDQLHRAVGGVGDEHASVTGVNGHRIRLAARRVARDYL